MRKLHAEKHPDYVGERRASLSQILVSYVFAVIVVAILLQPVSCAELAEQSDNVAKPALTNSGHSEPTCTLLRYCTIADGILRIIE